MGDHRASIKLEFAMHGVEAKQNMFINWSPDDNGCDRRITEWFEAQVEKAMDKWSEEQWQADKENRSRQVEEADRKEFARLKAKFEPTP